jgi:hypothetical protein
MLCYAHSAPLYCDITESEFRVDEEGTELEEPTVKVLLQKIEVYTNFKDLHLKYALLAS